MSFQLFLYLGNLRKTGNTQRRSSSSLSSDDGLSLSETVFRVIADWENFAILGLLNTDDFQSSEKWMAQRLGLSTIEVRAALKRLRKVGLIEKIESQWRRKASRVQTTHEIPSEALRISHRQTLEQAIQKLDEVPLELRSISSLSLAMDPKNLARAKKLIRSFERKMERLLESGKRSEVYNLNIQLVPVTRVRGI